MNNNMNNIMLESYITKISNNDLTALEMLYNETRNYVYRFALSILKNCSDAEDIMQDVYVNINKHASKYNSRQKPLAWILTITKNLCLNKIKANKKREYTDYSEIGELLGNNDDLAFNKTLLKTIIESLDDIERQIFILNSVENYKFREIANLLDIKLSTVLSKYHRAIKKIKALYLLEKDGNYEK